MKGVIMGEYKPELNGTTTNCGNVFDKETRGKLKRITSGELLKGLDFFLEEIKSQNGSGISLVFWFNPTWWRKVRGRSIIMCVGPKYNESFEYVFRRDKDFFVNYYHDPIRLIYPVEWVKDEDNGWLNGRNPCPDFVGEVNFYLRSPIKTSRAVL